MSGQSGPGWAGLPENLASCCRVEHAKENGLPYPSPCLPSGTKLSPQDPRPPSPGPMPLLTEKSSEKVWPSPRHPLWDLGCPEPGSRVSLGGLRLRGPQAS